jgi:hypothetical protein
MNDHMVLRKKLSTYETAKGQLRNVPPEVLLEVLKAWESWTGSTKDFYVSVGFSRRKMAAVIGKAKKLKREGHFPVEEFQEISLPITAEPSSQPGPCVAIELSWDSGRVIRFPRVDDLLDFLKKAA